jgi:hypothetical protein
MCLESYLDEQDELVLLLLAGPRQRVREQVVLGDRVGRRGEGWGAGEKGGEQVVLGDRVGRRGEVRQRGDRRGREG